MDSIEDYVRRHPHQYVKLAIDAILLYGSDLRNASDALNLNDEYQDLIDAAETLQAAVPDGIPQKEQPFDAGRRRFLEASLMWTDDQFNAFVDAGSTPGATHEFINFEKGPNKIFDLG